MTTARVPQLGIARGARQLTQTVLLLACGFSPAFAQTTGTIEGSVLTRDGVGLPGVVVSVSEVRRTTATDQNGTFSVASLPAGRYTVRFSVGEFEATATDVAVTAGATVRLEKRLPDDFVVGVSITVSGASRTLERLVDAPAAVSALTESQVSLRGGSGQVPSLLQFAPGVDMTQSGVYNLEFNARGFNTALSRRIQVLIDGRDAAAPESKNQEWLNVGFITPDIRSIELVRGPGAALYGANSMNGVLTIETRTPRASPGGWARVTTGDLGTFMGDVRWAGGVGGDWYLKTIGNHTTSGSFAKSRTAATEYAGLTLEVSPALDETTVTSGSLRADKYTGRGHQIILEGGLSRAEGGTYLSQAGRVAIDRSTRSWTRSEYRTADWRATAFYNGREAQQHTLYAPVAFPTSTWQVKLETQGQRGFGQGRGRLIGGASFLREGTDSADETGRQALYLEALTTNAAALFGHADYQVTPTVKAVAAVRWDESTLHPAQVSPRVALVFSPAPSHSIRLTASRGFQVGNYTELYLNIPAAPPADLSAVEAALAPLLGGVPLGLGVVPVFAIGNVNLDVESITTIEAGYTATFGARARVTMDVYRNRVKNFISDLLPGVNPAFPAYRAPASLPAATRALVESTLIGIVGPALTNLPNGGAQVVLSNANVGDVRSRGVELGASIRPQDGWTIDASYTWFGFTTVNPQPGLEPKPNSPAHRGAMGVTYDRPRFTASWQHKWVGAFTWASGVFAGPVPSYGVSDLAARIDLSSRWQVGANVANLFDNRHYQMFGGDILRRRALVHLTAQW